MEFAMNLEQCKHYKAEQFLTILLKDFNFSAFSSKILHLISILSIAADKFLLVSLKSRAFSYSVAL